MKLVSFYQSPRTKPTPFTKPQRCNQGTSSNISKSCFRNKQSHCTRRSLQWFRKETYSQQPQYCCFGAFLTLWNDCFYMEPICFPLMNVLNIDSHMRSLCSPVPVASPAWNAITHKPSSSLCPSTKMLLTLKANLRVMLSEGSTPPIRKLSSGKLPNTVSSFSSVKREMKASSFNLQDKKKAKQRRSVQNPNMRVESKLLCSPHTLCSHGDSFLE